MSQGAFSWMLDKDLDSQHGIGVIIQQVSLSGLVIFGAELMSM
jgi:hypothetical protein